MTICSHVHLSYWSPMLVTSSISPPPSTWVASRSSLCTPGGRHPLLHTERCCWIRIPWRHYVGVQPWNWYQAGIRHVLLWSACPCLERVGFDWSTFPPDKTIGISWAGCSSTAICGEECRSGTERGTYPTEWFDLIGSSDHLSYWRPQTVIKPCRGPGNCWCLSPVNTNRFFDDNNNVCACILQWRLYSPCDFCWG